MKKYSFMEKEKTSRKCVSFSVLTAIATRLIFVVHSFIAIWRVTDVLKDPMYWLLLSVLGLLLIETLVTLVKRKGAEWKWFCPSFFIYLCSMVPPIWILEIDRIERYRRASDNVTVCGDVKADSSDQALSAIEGVVIPIKLSADMWVKVLEQTMLLILIIGRWMLPKGEITRDQLSQLLFVYIGMASDIMEIMVLFEEKPVLKDDYIGFAILTVWSLSLMQFTLVLTATKARRAKVALISPDQPPDSPPEIRSAATTPPDSFTHVLYRETTKGPSCYLCETEIWSILTTILMQDGPFLSLRLFVLIRFKIMTYSILFYTSKNALVVMLQLYRIIVITCAERKKFNEKREEEMRADLASSRNGGIEAPSSAASSRGQPPAYEPGPTISAPEMTEKL